MTDELRPIPGYEGLYSVTSDGRVWSIERTSMRNGFPCKVNGRWLKPQKHSAGYLVVNLYANDEVEQFLLHRVVAVVWLPAPKDGRTNVNHIDSVRTNNHVSNLEWCTALENNLHTIRMGRGNFNSPARRDAQVLRGKAKRKLSTERVQRLTELRESGSSLRQIAQELGVCSETVRRIAAGLIYQDRKEPTDGL